MGVFPGGPQLPADPLERAVAEDRMRRQGEQMMKQMLQNTLNNPQEVRSIAVHLMAMRVEEEQLILSIALPSGTRMDFAVTDAFVDSIAQYASTREKGEVEKDVEKGDENP